MVGHVPVRPHERTEGQVTHLEDVSIRRDDDVRVTFCGREIDTGVLLHAIAFLQPMPEHDCTDQIDETDCAECLRIARQRHPVA